MKLVTFCCESKELRPGVLTEAGVVDLVATDPSISSSIREIFVNDELKKASAAAASDSAVLVQNATLRAPISDPQKIVCIGLNYREHAIESGMAKDSEFGPSEPTVFSKFPSAILGPEESINIPAASKEVDYEAELVVVVGRRAKAVSKAEAMDYVAGYTIGNDVSARDWQLKKPGGQWMMGKTFDTFAPIGPAIVTTDEIPNPESLSITLRLNGETMQDSTTGELIFGIAEVVSYLSQVFTLEPGDLIFTGTPSGVGFARKPPVFLKAGDVCEVEIEGLGVLRNPCV
ncbi:MAG: fumarylacetoacetate hydrolase family protein [Planctomycetes bacterium]|nr:fumarylacetoacetate hydrolase family protein [Planctomycetota bacterium]